MLFTLSSLLLLAESSTGGVCLSVKIGLETCSSSAEPLPGDDLLILCRNVSLLLCCTVGHVVWITPWVGYLRGFLTRFHSWIGTDMWIWLGLDPD